jgi:hypothetical protein
VCSLDLGNPVYKAAFIPSRNEIWLNNRVKIEPLTLLHEVTHYYQRNRLGREMKTGCAYDLPSDLSVPMDVEQEAMLVMAYASIVDPQTCPPSGKARPTKAESLRYLRVFMLLDPEQ